jgi:hypothetical protein
MATYNISTLDELQAMSSHLADDCVLLNDIDASATREWNEIQGFPGTYYGFLPIGTNTAPFTGTFDGGGYTISNLYINRGNNSGLFGIASIANGTIHDLVITNMTIKCNTQGGAVGLLAGQISGTSGNDYVVAGVVVSGVILDYASGAAGVGGLVGVAINATYDDCFSSVSITTTGAAGGGGGVGGFVGNTTSADFTSCVSGGVIISSGTPEANLSGYYGGFAGQAISSATYFTSCKSSTTIIDSMITSGSGWTSCGGFIGYDNLSICKYCIATGNITSLNTHNTYCGGFGGYLKNSFDECAATGNVAVPQASGTAYVGGFSGRDSAVITECYAKGDVCKSGIGAGAYAIGGFAGYNTTNKTDCYCAGYVNPNSSNSGGFVGYKPSGTLTRCHWDTDTSEMTTGVGGGGSQTGVTGHTTVFMQIESTYTSWDFDAVWVIGTVVQPATLGSNITVWPSRTGDYENFAAGVKDDDSFSLVVPTQNEIRWLAALESLLLGTAGDEWKIGSNKLETPLTPTNFVVRQQSEYGSASVQPVKINSSLLFVDFVARKLREMTYVDPKYESPDLTALAEHITLNGITSIARQKNPDSILWMTLGDGSLISMTYERDQNVVAWAKHPLGGNGYAQSVCVIPGASEDVIYLSVCRTLTGDTVYWEGEEVYWEDVLVTDYIGEVVYIEKMAPRVFTAIEDAFFVDCGVTFESVSPTSTITGLDHLDGETVKVLGDGVVLDDAVVEDGQITAKLAGVVTTVSKANVGLAQTYKLQPMRIVLGQGQSMGKNTRVNNLVISFLNTWGAKQGSTATGLLDINFDDVRWTNSADITGLFAGEVVVSRQGGYDPLNPILISGDSPLPCTVRCIVPDIDITG